MNLENSPQCWYGDMYKEDEFALRRIKLCLELLKPYLKPKSKILDIGCYNAALLGFLPKDVDYYGVDFDQEALEIAKKKGANVKRVSLNDEEIDFGIEFDIIICTEVLEHLVNPAKMLKQIKKLIKKEGVILFSFPNECTIYHRIMCLLGKGVDMCAFQLYKHLHLPTIKQSENFVSSYFKVIKTAFFVNPGGKKTRWEFLGKITSKIPYGFWIGLANIYPNLFARGVIFLCKNR